MLIRDHDGDRAGRFEPRRRRRASSAYVHSLIHGRSATVEEKLSKEKKKCKWAKFFEFQLRPSGQQARRLHRVSAVRSKKLRQRYFHSLYLYVYVGFYANPSQVDHVSLEWTIVYGWQFVKECFSVINKRIINGCTGMYRYAMKFVDEAELWFRNIWKMLFWCSLIRLHWMLCGEFTWRLSRLLNRRKNVVNCHEVRSVLIQSWRIL